MTCAAVGRGNTMDPAGWRAVGTGLEGCLELEEIDGMKCQGLVSGASFDQFILTSWV